MVTIDVLAFRHHREALAALRSPARLFTAEPSFATAFISGAGTSVHAPWVPAADLGLVAGLWRKDGWGSLALRRVTVIASWGATAEGRPGARRVDESWRGRFEPLRSHGTLDGRDPLAAGERARTAGVPGTIFTCGSGGRHPIAFLRQTNHVVESLHRAPGLRTAFGLFALSRTGTKFATFSCWDDLDAAVAYAYRNSAEHRRAIEASGKRYRTENYFARLRLVTSTGTIAGRNPFEAPATSASVA